MYSYYRHWDQPASTIACTGNDDCPICKTFSEFSKPKKKFMVNILDEADGEMKIMTLSESAYKQMVGKFERLHRIQRIKNWFSNLRFEIKHWRYYVCRLGRWIKGVCKRKEKVDSIPA